MFNLALKLAIRAQMLLNSLEGLVVVPGFIRASLPR
jgi:hypothetical protein